IVDPSLLGTCTVAPCIHTTGRITLEVIGTRDVMWGHAMNTVRLVGIRTITNPELRSSTTIDRA
ncbi:hypothetical protein AVEN_119964-1, partial [Araneus ventricosus]